MICSDVIPNLVCNAYYRFKRYLIEQIILKCQNTEALNVVWVERYFCESTLFGDTACHNNR